MSYAKVKATGEIIEVDFIRYFGESDYASFYWRERGGKGRCFDGDDLVVPTKTEIEKFLNKGERP